AYETGLGTRLTQHERAAIPLAMARQPLWSIAIWVALLDSQDTARRHLAATAPELNWALQLTGRITQVQKALTGRPSSKGHPAPPAQTTTRKLNIRRSNPAHSPDRYRRGYEPKGRARTFPPDDPAPHELALAIIVLSACQTFGNVLLTATFPSRIR